MHLENNFNREDNRVFKGVASPLPVGDIGKKPNLLMVFMRRLLRFILVPPRFRVIPVTMAIALLAVIFQGYQIWTGIETGVARAEEQQEGGAIGDGAVADNAEDGANHDSDNPDEQVFADDLSDPDNAFLDPLMGLTTGEVELLQRLADRRQELDDENTALVEREALLEAAEGRFDEKMEELTGIRDEISALLGEYDDEQQAQLDQIVSIYEKMDPKDAARIFDSLDMTVLLAVIENMNISKSAPILAEMDSMRANQVTTELATRLTWPSQDEF